MNLSLQGKSTSVFSAPYQITATKKMCNLLSKGFLILDNYLIQKKSNGTLYIYELQAAFTLLFRFFVE